MTADDIDLRCGDCLALMDTLPDGKCDMILCDLPYGALSDDNAEAAWDCQIPLNELWPRFWRVCKPNAAVVLFAQGMFTAQLMMSFPDRFRYTLVWNKMRSSGFLNAKRMPLRCHEDIVVFYRSLPTYNPQMVPCADEDRTHSRGKMEGAIRNSCYGKFGKTQTKITNFKFPNSILSFPKPAPTETVHPTQKSVDLCRYLIRTFTNEGETVFDATMGSGTTGVASVLEKRRFVGFEKEQRYFDIASKRIGAELGKPKQGTLFDL